MSAFGLPATTTMPRLTGVPHHPVAAPPTDLLPSVPLQLPQQHPDLHGGSIPRPRLQLRLPSSPRASRRATRSASSRQARAAVTSTSASSPAIRAASRSERPARRSAESNERPPRALPRGLPHGPPHGPPHTPRHGARQATDRRQDRSPRRPGGGPWAMLPCLLLTLGGGQSGNPSPPHRAQARPVAARTSTPDHAPSCR